MVQRFLLNPDKIGMPKIVTPAEAGAEKQERRGFFIESFVPGYDENVFLFVVRFALWGLGLGGGGTLTNCTFSGNSAGHYGGGMYSNSGSSIVTNCILWGNTASSGGNEIALTNFSTIDVVYSDVQSGQAGIYDDGSGNTINWGSGNINADPLFADPNGPDGIIGTEDDNLRLQYSSPCIDDANNIFVPAGVTTDLDGRDRIVDGDCDETETVDMGAYEFDWLYIGDFDGECDVDLADFAIFTLAWLTEEGEGGYNPDCDISIPADDTIDMLDAEIVFRNWLAGR